MPWPKHHKHTRWKGHENFRDNLHSLRTCNKITIYKEGDEWSFKSFQIQQYIHGWIRIIAYGTIDTKYHNVKQKTQGTSWCFGLHLIIISNKSFIHWNRVENLKHISEKHPKVMTNSHLAVVNIASILKTVRDKYMAVLIIDIRITKHMNVFVYQLSVYETILTVYPQE